MGLDSQAQARVQFLSFFKVGFGFYPVEFRVFFGFQIFVRKRHIFGKYISIKRFNIKSLCIKKMLVIFLVKC